MSDDATLLKLVRDFVAHSRALNGDEVHEREPWHIEVTADAVRHHAYGISDDNPLWVDPAYAQSGPFGGLVAPPSFLCSVLYPALHGAPVPASLSSLIVEVGYEWFEPIPVGDRIRAAARQVDALESRDGEGRPLALIVSRVNYWNQHGRLVAEATATVARAPQIGTSLRVERDIYRYRDDELWAIKAAQRHERRSGRRSPDGAQLTVGDPLPELVRGPMTLGDLVCWQAAIGPSYRPGALGYQDTVKTPHTTVSHPVTGWPVKSSQQHEDFLLAAQRGMPAPFDNGVMRWAWISPLLTNWIGDDGTLERLSVQLSAPNLYGDTTWYRGRVAAVVEKGTEHEVSIELTGTNQLGATTTSGQAVVRLPTRRGPGQPRRVGTAPAGRVEDGGTPSILDRLDQQMRRAPDAVAVVGDAQAWTYRDVRDRAAGLAARLSARGVTRGDRVAVCLPRSGDWIPTMVGVLRAGGALVPLDPSYPPARLHTMVKETKPRLVIASSESQRLLSLPDRQVLHLEDAGGAGPRHDPAAARPGRRDIAYIVFTSGSTGAPHGVTVPHGALARYADVMARRLEVGPDDTFLHTAAFSFSASMRQVFVPLTAGATLVVASEAQRRDPLALAALMATQRVTVWDTVPSVWRLVLESWSTSPPPYGREAALRHLRLVALTGEPLTWHLLSLWRNQGGTAAQIVNLYSHSETAGTAAAFTVPRPDASSRGFVSLGRPVGGSRLYVLDEHRTPCRPGTVGDIWVGGDRLARGYLNQPALTRQRFVDDPFREGPGARMFRTGDRGRRLGDGSVEFAGRADQQVNIRGHRIEPGEIEHALREHPGVREVVVAPRTNPAGETCLVAYVVPHPTASPTVDGQPRYRLPNHLALVHLNQHETDFTYRATFEDQTYLKHGITLDDGDCVFDVGANIGQFSLFVHRLARASRLLAFEPNPRARAALAANLRLYRVNGRVFPYGLGKAEGHARFTAFDGFSILSGLHADREAEKALVRTYMANAASGNDAPRGSDGEVEQILADRFAARTFDVAIRTLSSVIDEQGVDRIDLLKINVEKAELDVILGIRPEHWSRIGQLVVKVDRPETVPAIVSRLESQGLECAVDQDALMRNTRVQTVYAIRPSDGRRLIRQQAPGAHRRVVPTLTDPLVSPDRLHQVLARRLPDYMRPAFVMMLPSLPLGPHGKVDRHGLPEPDWSHPAVGQRYQAPDSPAERQLTRIWADVLGVEQVGVHDDFLELGGDSIKAMRIVNRVRQDLHASLQQADVFANPTVGGLARVIATVTGG